MLADMTPASWALLICVFIGLTVLMLVVDDWREAPVRAMWRGIAHDLPDAVGAAYLIGAGITVAALSGAPSGSTGRDFSWVLLGTAVPVLAVLWLRLTGRAGSPRPLT